MGADDGRTAPDKERRGLPAFFADMPLEMFRKRFGRAWTLEVVEAFDVTPRMRRVVYTGKDLGDLTCRPGQEIIMMLPGADGDTLRRHYTIRSFDPASRRLDVDFVLHGDSPAGRYARGAKAGDTLTILGPRGRNVIREGADWRLFLGDEAALPAIFGMAESLPAGARARVFIEISGDIDKQPLDSAADVDLTWLPRRDAAPGESRVLARAAAEVALPEGVGHIYVLGETSAVRAARQGLIARGVPKDRIFAEGYWRPGRVGGHDHVDD